MNWIQDFTDIPDISGRELATACTMATCEVEDFVEKGIHLDRVVVSQITAIAPHPHADKLQLVTVDTGVESQQVVCGAPGLATGQKVPYAPLNTTLPGGLTLVPKAIRGIESLGMLCAEDELGLGDDHSTLMQLPAQATIGTPLSRLFDLTGDTLLDIDNKSITHRPDLWGHYGMAREFSCIFDTPRSDFFNSAWEKKIISHMNTGQSPIRPRVEESACTAYYGLSISNIFVQDSPLWMKQRLTNCGIRPINNMVDISNYVMLELGIPLHIFDRNRITDNTIIVRRAQESESVQTLDGEIRNLEPHDTVVCDSSEPLVIAGIMGGERSGVTQETQDLFIEVANWNAAEIRKTSARIGLRTDSSQRYEKSLDSQLLYRTMLRTADLIFQLCPEARVEGNIEKAGPETGPYTPIDITVEKEKICRVLGKDISVDTILHILQKLDFSVTVKDETFHIQVPSFRATKDIECDADIIEEIGRIIGYDNITPDATYERIRPSRIADHKQRERTIRDFLVLRGNMLETMTYPMIGKSLLKKAHWQEKNENLTLVNAISKDHSIMRPSLVPSFLEAAALNARNFSRFSAFEIGRAYTEDTESFSREEDILALMLYDTSHNRFLELRNILEALIRYIAAPVTVKKPTRRHNTLVDRKWAGLHPHETLDIEVMGQPRGFITTLHPLPAQKLKIKGALSMAFFSLEELKKTGLREKNSYSPLPKYPGSTFDCTVIAPKNAEAARVVQTIQKLKLPHVDSVKIADVFRLTAEEKTITVRTRFLNREATLDHAFIQKSQDAIVAGLRKAGFPLKE
jgi:phenylalanyl-tRNA synthetase beta chain